MKKIFAHLVCLAALVSCSSEVYDYDVIVAGGSASGVCAGIQAARSGANTLILEEGPWLGGMLTSAGVSAIDGNYRLRSGIFGEFCDSLALRYGGYEALKTGWVSNILFEPHAGAEIFDNMAALTQNLEVLRNTTIKKIEKLDRGWRISTSNGDFTCRILIDCTVLGDVAKMCGVRYSIGNENGVVQDMTYVITIQDFGPDADRTIPEPEGYKVENYANCCANPLNSPPYSPQAPESCGPHRGRSPGL